MREKLTNIRSHRRKRNGTNLPISQKEYEDVLIDFIIDGMLPLSIVSLDAFKRYTHSKFFSKNIMKN